MVYNNPLVALYGHIVWHYGHIVWTWDWSLTNGAIFCRFTLLGKVTKNHIFEGVFHLLQGDK